MSAPGTGRFVDHRLLDLVDGEQLLPGWIGRLELARQRAIDDLNACSAGGVTTVIDTSPIGVARAEAIALCSSLTDIDTIFASGVDADHLTSAVLRSSGPTQLADVFIAELTDGIAQTAVLPRVLLHGAGAHGDFAGAVLRAVSFAHAETGVPVIARADGVSASDVVKQLMGRGVDPERIVAVGLDAASPRFDVIDEVARSGAWLGFTATGDRAASPAARGAVIAYALRTSGPGRIVINARGSEIDQLFAALTESGVDTDALAEILTNRPEAFP